MTRRALPLAALLALVAASSGASCPVRPQGALPPSAFTAPPTLDEAIATINRNSDHIGRMQAESAKLSVKGLPKLKASLALERPRRFRLEASFIGLTGADLDLGSNDQLFWFWTKHNKPEAVYFARHEQFHQSAAQQILPIEPQWLIEALGLLHLDPAGAHQGPYSRQPGRFEIHSKVPSVAGEMTRITVVDERTGWVLEQQMYDPRGRLLATARASEHRVYAAERTALPRRVDVELPPVQLAFTLEIGEHWVNQITGDPSQLWSMPAKVGSPAVDLADPRFLPTPQVGLMGPQPAPDAEAAGVASSPGRRFGRR